MSSNLDNNASEGDEGSLVRKLSIKELKQADLRSEFREVLLSTKITDVIGEKRDLLVLDENESLEHALKVKKKRKEKN